MLTARKSWFTAFAISVLGLMAMTLSAASLDDYLSDTPAGDLVPGGEAYGKAADTAPIVPVRLGDKTVGHVFLNTDFAKAIGYSGKPIHILVGIDLRGRIVGTRLVEHSEPIVLIGIPERKITDALAVYKKLDAVEIARGGDANRQIDAVSGATVTIMVMDDSILNAAAKVVRLLGLGGLRPLRKADGRKATIKADIIGERDWADLLGDGSVRRLKLTVGEVNEAFTAAGDPAAAKRPEPGEPNDLFVDIYVAQASVPTIGRSLLGRHEYDNLVRTLQPGQQALLVVGTGRYSFKGSGYVRGGIFDRFHVRQADTTIRFHDFQHKRLRQVAADGAPDFEEVGLFRVSGDAGFSAVEPWQFELLVGRATGPTSKAFVNFSTDYAVPDRYLDIETAPAEPATNDAGGEAAVATGSPLWQRIWAQKAGQIVILIIALGVLTAVFFFQDWLVKRPKLTDRVRLGFLIFTLFGIGWYANAQLSVVNILTVFNAMLTSFDWEFFLNEPLIFILWGAVASSLLFWGRGVYCGWLCPFGALQELLNKLAKKLNIRQVRVPWWLHERLWTLKYVIFLVLFGVSLYSFAMAEKLAEVEPFKTAIILKFVREWPFVLFAVGVLAAGLFIERFYCRYVCPLGAALAIPGKIRMFEWLKRYHQCGNPCQICARDCMVQAIHKEGNINPNECLYCLNCQTIYQDENRCFVLVQRKLKRERRHARQAVKRPLGETIRQIQQAESDGFSRSSTT